MTRHKIALTLTEGTCRYIHGFLVNCAHSQNTTPPLADASQPLCIFRRDHVEGEKLPALTVEEMIDQCPMAQAYLAMMEEKN